MPILFADATNLFSSVKNFRTLENHINNELSNISLWLKMNKLVHHIKKKHHMVISQHKSLYVDVE